MPAATAPIARQKVPPAARSIDVFSDVHPDIRTDAELLRIYARTQDAEAFAEILRRHTRLVFGVARRITGNVHDAEDVTQACFFEMACKAGTICAPLPAWLHTAATYRAINAVRDASTRRRYEHQAITRREIPLESEWRDVEPLVDSALESLPPELRRPLIMRFLEDRTQEEIAKELGVDQSTVSRRMGVGLGLLRRRLRAAGVVASIAALSAMLARYAIESAPATLKISLGKMAMAGVTRTLSGPRVYTEPGGASSVGEILPKPISANVKLACGIGVTSVVVLALMAPTIARQWRIGWDWTAHSNQPASAEIEFPH